MRIIDWFVILSVTSTLLFAWIVFILQVQKSRYENVDLSEEEERLVELMGKVRVFVDSKLELLDKKLEEVREVIKALNDKYVEFSALLLESEARTSSSLANNVTTNITEAPNPVPSSKNEAEHPLLLVSDAQFQKDKQETSGIDFVNLAADNFETESFEDKVYKLYLNGLEPIDIAKRLGAGVGEVMLVIDLLKRQEKR
uniref:Uncharacterized protein n=1 Tax=Fervidobacterium thailandense TaxID=1008305 RepID=A0A7C4CF07_9BACT